MVSKPPIFTLTSVFFAVFLTIVAILSSNLALMIPAMLFAFIALLCSMVEDL